MTMSIPSMWSSGNMSPASTTTMRPSCSMAAQLRPISPRPPRNVTRTVPLATDGSKRIHDLGRGAVECLVGVRVGQSTLADAQPEMAQHTRTIPLASIDELEGRIEALRAAADRFDRDPAEIEVVLAGPWGMLDLRRGFEVERMLDEAGRLAELGVDCVVSLVCGDDLGASLATVDAFGAEVAARAR